MSSSAKQDNTPNDTKGPTKTKSLKSSRADIFGVVLGYIIFLAVAFLIAPRLSFVTADYVLWLPIGFWATTISSFFDLLAKLSKPSPFQHLFKIGNLIPSIYSTYKLIEIYPLDFTSVGYPVLDEILPFAFTIAVLAMVFAIVINLMKFVVGLVKR